MGGRTGESITSDMLKPIPGYPHYMACSDGRVFSLYSMSWLQPYLCKTTGYLQISVCEGGKKMTRCVHRLIAGAFIEKPSDDFVVNHKDENKLNNHPENLEWIPLAENTRYGTARLRAAETIGIEALRESAAKARAVNMKLHERPVIDLDAGKTYPSIRDAAHATGLRRTGIWAACNKKQKTCGGRRWAYESEVVA